jgi:2-hydroxychromene-2-carboxylate isomerase
MPSPIEFYFDLSSPYAYFARHAIEPVAAHLGRGVTWKPIMIGAAFKASGNVPLVQQPMKGRYSVRDWARMGRLMNVPWVLPDPFPIATLAGARAFYWQDAQDPARAVALAKTLFDAYFGQGIDIGGAAKVAELAQPLGIAKADLLAAIEAPQWKQRLKDETEKAIERGVFGAPFFFLDGEPFWGVDRLPMLEEWAKRGGF